MIRRSVAVGFFCAWTIASVFAAATAEASHATEIAEATAGPQTVLRWKARSEKGVYGYLVYRANVEHGPYHRVNREIIHVNPQTLEDPSEYRFVDRDVEVGRTYYYYLDTIADNGKKSRFSKVISKTVTAP